MSEPDRAPRAWARPRTDLRCAVLALLLAACATPGAPLLSDVQRDPTAPERDAEGAVRTALELARLGPTQLFAPDPASLADPGSDPYWTTLALAWDPDVRQRRRAWLARVEARRSAGAPQPVQLQVVDHESLGQGMVEAAATFDLVGLLGLGPSAAAREVADGAALTALAGLEAGAFAAEVGALRARLALAAVRARISEVEELLAEARADRLRFAILDRTGRLAAGQLALAEAGVEQLEVRGSDLRERESSLRAELARRVGLPLEHPSLDVPGPADLARWAERPVPGLPEDVRRVDSHPELRRARVDFALAEARVRAAAAAAWPGVQLGPHLSFDDGTRVGGLLRLSLPWPSAWRGELAAAEQRREAAREAFEDLWLGLLVREADARRRLDETAERRTRHTTVLLAARRTDWEATRARFRVGRATPMEWSDALMRRRQVLTQDVDDAEARALALCDLLTALGPAALREASPDGRAEPDPVGASLARADTGTRRTGDARSMDRAGGAQ